MSFCRPRSWEYRKTRTLMNSAMAVAIGIGAAGCPPQFANLGFQAFATLADCLLLFRRRPVH
jgi:hypothetical protein